MFCAPNNIFAIFSQATRAVISSDICAGAVTPPVLCSQSIVKSIGAQNNAFIFLVASFYIFTRGEWLSKIGGGSGF